MCGVMDESTVADVQTGVGDALGTIAEEKQVSGLKVVAIDGGDTAPRRLQVGVAGHDDSTLAEQHLREAGAIEAEIRGASPGVGDADEFFGDGDHLIDGQRSEIGADITFLDESLLVIGQPNLQPAIAVADLVWQNFQTAFPGNGQERSVFCDIRLTIKIGTELGDSDDGAGCGIGLAVELSKVCDMNPAGVIIGSFDLDPAPFGFQAGHVGGIDDLRDHVGVLTGLAVHIDDGPDDDVISGMTVRGCLGNTGRDVRGREKKKQCEKKRTSNAQAVPGKHAVIFEYLDGAGQSEGFSSAGATAVKNGRPRKAGPAKAGCGGRM